ncbi:MAG: peptidoglycan DD-metalloendopeptidase family protein [Hyphomonas sp.]|nr:peptidoglycan DD-metalloendopeptidase family protein [Hyphomonas sp.]MCA8905957.1 peptidoglycan DD-metalloendopeptidase family protein [Hyphomonas sp.]MCB9970676.1 peptidoglycan DD-metalloendopeptidase family protein [Hyphomonas sp.]HPE48504.1 peptidoglycan DD-metalloendopeptidase family protein [Hyphomonas sp.]
MTPDPARLHILRARYDDWLAQSVPPPVPVVPGLPGAAHLALDGQGLAARGWDGLPIDWVPEGGAVQAGGYGEDRSIYDTPAFRQPGEEPRTVHLGLDVFAAPGTPVHCPLAGEVHSFQRNDADKDYGPTIILRHAPERDLVFYSLYGHLAPESLAGLKPGAAVGAGEAIGEIGTNAVNGGWAPHLHFQVILDLLGRSGDFPGVCRRSEAAAWLALCPDPAALAGWTQRS